MDDLYVAVAAGLTDGIDAADVSAAIGATKAGSPSDPFWAAWDHEVSRIRGFFLGVADDPVVAERIARSRTERGPQRPVHPARRRR